VRTSLQQLQPPEICSPQNWSANHFLLSCLLSPDRSSSRRRLLPRQR
jgi:hypothetical protein